MSCQTKRWRWPTCEGRHVFGKLDIVQEYWTMPLAAEVQEMLTIPTPKGLFIPTRVPQDGLNATSIVAKIEPIRPVRVSRGFESQAEIVLPENSGDPGHSGLSMGLS